MRFNFPECKLNDGRPRAKPFAARLSAAKRLLCRSVLAVTPILPRNGLVTGAGCAHAHEHGSALSGGPLNKIARKGEYAGRATPCSRVTNRPGCRRANAGPYMIHKLMLLASGLLAGLSVPAYAAPVFLKCSLNNTDNTLLKVDVQLNEEAGTVSYAFPDLGRAYTVRAIFTPTEVSFGSFFVSRTDLSFKRANGGALSRIANDPSVSYGKCEVNKTTRAF